MAAAGGASREEEPASDILFQDENVCILKPDSPRGILIFHFTYKSFSDLTEKICKEGLNSYSELRRKYPELALPERKHPPHNADHDDLIYFRAPYTTDGSSFEAAYGGETPESMVEDTDEKALVIIRVDPAKTNVFFSEARANTNVKKGNKPFNYYKKTLQEYMQSKHNRGAFYGTPLHTKTKSDPTERMWEVVVKLPHIPPEWFVQCLYNGPDFKVTEPFVLEQIDKNLNTIFREILLKIPYIESVNIMKYSFDPEHLRRIRIKTNKEREGHDFEIVFKINISTLLIENESHQGDVLTHIDLTQEELDRLYGLIDKFLERMKELVVEYRETHKNNNKNSGAAPAAGGAAGGASGGGRRKNKKLKNSKKCKKSKRGGRKTTTRRHPR